MVKCQSRCYRDLTRHRSKNISIKHNARNETKSSGLLDQKRDTQMIPENELFEYLTQHPLPHDSGGVACNTPPTPSQQYMVFSHLDYATIRYGAPMRSPLDAFPRYPFPEDLFRPDEMTHGAMGYRYGMRLKPAGVYYWQGHTKDMGSILDFHGDDLTQVRSVLRIDDDALLQRLMFKAEAVTRLDFCTNINAGNVADCSKAWDEGHIKTRARKGLDYVPKGEAIGATCRVGSDKSNKFVRIYDKAAELKLLHEVLTRIELQTRHGQAHRMAHVMLDSGVKATGKSVIRTFVDFPKIDWYQAALHTADTINASLKPREKGNTAKWLQDYVGPAIRKSYERGEYTTEIRDWLYQMHEFTRGR